MAKAREEHWIDEALNPNNKGDLHRRTRTPKGKKIPAAKLEKALHSKDPKTRHEAQFAENVRKGKRK